MPTDAPQPSFVLIRPQMGENIGAAARAMLEFRPRPNADQSARKRWLAQSKVAVAMASGAGRAAG